MNISDQIAKKIHQIELLLQQEKDILIKYDKKRNIVKVFSQKIKRIK